MSHLSHKCAESEESGTYESMPTSETGGGRGSLSCPTVKRVVGREASVRLVVPSRFTVGLVLRPCHYHPFHCWASSRLFPYPFHCWARIRAGEGGYLPTHYGRAPPTRVYMPPYPGYLRMLKRGYEPHGAHCDHAGTMCTPSGCRMCTFITEVGGERPLRRGRRLSSQQK